MTKFLHLHADSFSYETSVPDPDDSWGRASTATSWHVHGVSLSDADGYRALPADFPVEPGETVHVVYAIYSTGDSFGHDAGAQLEVLSFHKDAAIAKQNADHAVSRVGDDNYRMTITTDSGGKISRECPWDGYFESLDGIHMETFTVSYAP